MFPAVVAVASFALLFAASCTAPAAAPVAAPDSTPRASALSPPSQDNNIDECLLGYEGGADLEPHTPEKLPAAAIEPREVQTGNGVKEISRTAGYRVLYYNRHKAPLVNLKVERSEPDLYERDQKNLLDHLRYLAKRSTTMESHELTELEFNGFEILGLSRDSLDYQGSNLATLVMFPGNNITVYFYFENLKPAYQTFDSLNAYKAVRDAFLSGYTHHIASCPNR